MAAPAVMLSAISEKSTGPWALGLPSWEAAREARGTSARSTFLSRWGVVWVDILAVVGVTSGLIWCRSASSCSDRSWILELGEEGGGREETRKVGDARGVLYVFFWKQNRPRLRVKCE